MAKRKRGKGMREAENSRTFDISGLFSQLWEEMRKRWLEVGFGHEPVPLLVKVVKGAWKKP